MYMLDKAYWKGREEVIKFRFKLRELAKDEEGAEIMEYAIVIALVAALVAVIAGIVFIVKGKLDQAYKAVDAIPTAPEAYNGGGGAVVTPPAGVE